MELQETKDLQYPNRTAVLKATSNSEGNIVPVHINEAKIIGRQQAADLCDEVAMALKMDSSASKGEEPH